MNDLQKCLNILYINSTLLPWVSCSKGPDAPEDVADLGRASNIFGIRVYLSHPWTLFATIYLYLKVYVMHCSIAPLLSARFAPSFCLVVEALCHVLAWDC
jgi:hypothetical protein